MVTEYEGNWSDERVTQTKADAASAALRFFEINGVRHRATRTGKVRFKLHKRWFRKNPLLILQLEESIEIEKRRNYGDKWWAQHDQNIWRNAKLEDLSVMDVSNLTLGREGGEMPVCFRPMFSMNGPLLILQIMNGSVGAAKWTDAKLQDLLFKEGQILGGVGLVAR